MSIRLVWARLLYFYHGFSRFSFGKTGEAGEVILEIWFGSGRLYPIDRSAHFYHNSSDQRPDHRHQSAGSVQGISLQRCQVCLDRLWDQASDSEQV